MEDIKKIEEQLTKNNITALVLKSSNYFENLKEIIGILSKNNQNICYVSANKPEKTIQEMIASNNLGKSKFVIVDCVTKNIPQEEKGHEATIFIQSPKNLTRLSLTIKKLLNQMDVIFIESLSTFLLYEGESVVIRFAHDLISKIRDSKRKCVFIILGEEVSKNLISDLGMFVDGVIDMGTKETSVKNNKAPNSKPKLPLKIQNSKEYLKV